jgi:hypothetical protein
MKSIERWNAEMPTEAEMRPKDKYTFFDKKEKGFRKGVHGMFFKRCFLDLWDSNGRRDWVLMRNRIAKVDEG